MGFLKKMDDALAKFEVWLIIAFLSLMVGFTFLQAVFRDLYTHGHLQWANAVMGGLAWSESLVRLLVLWLTFLGASLLTREGKQINIDLFSSVLGGKWLALRDLTLSLVCLLVLGLMFKVSLTYVLLERDFGGTLFLRIPTWVGQLILPFGFASLLFRFLIRGIQAVRGLIKGQTQ